MSRRPVAYSYKATESFWRAFYSLPPAQKEKTREVWRIFKIDPFDPRLRTHKVERLSGIAKTTVYSVVVESNLRILFKIQGNVVVTMDMGTHAIYR